MAEKSIILFDGVCNVCNGFVNFLILRDEKDQFQFGSLQSPKVKELLHQYHYDADDLSTVILIEQNKLYPQSTAVLKIFRQMSGAWPLMYAFIIIPKALRDFIYQIIARNRYTLFGRKNSCMVPTPEWKAKFVE